MSSLFDTAIGSDLPFVADNRSDAGASRRPRSSSRGLPSESAAGHSDHEGLPDDEVVGARGTLRRARGPGGDIPKVVDEIGEHMVQQFEDFLET